MAWKRGPRKTTKPKDADTKAKLLITLRTREKVWITGDEATIKALRLDLHKATREETGLVDLTPHSEASVRLEQIDVLQYFPPKAAGPEPEATKEP